MNMILIFTIIIANAVAIFSDFPRLRKNGHKKEVIFFFSLLFLGNTIIILFVAGVQLPHVVNWVTPVIQPISELIFNIFKK